MGGVYLAGMKGKESPVPESELLLNISTQEDFVLCSFSVT